MADGTPAAEHERCARLVLLHVDGRDFAVIAHALSVLRNTDATETLRKLYQQASRQVPGFSGAF